MLERRRLLATAASALTIAAARGAGAQTPVRIGFIPVLGSAPLFVVNGAGWAREAGLALALTQFESGPNAIQAVASGTLDGYVAGFAPVAVVRARGTDLRIVAATAVEELVFLARGPLGQGIAAEPDPKAAFARFFATARRPARLATQPAGSVPNTVLQRWLWQVAAVDRAHVELVPMGIDATQQALLAGAVDGATAREPSLTIVRDRDPSVVVVGGKDLFENQPGGVLALTGSFIDRHAQAAERLVGLFVRATELLQRDPGAATPHVAAALGKGIVPEETIRRALISPASKFVADPRAIVGPTRALLDYQVVLGTTDAAPAPEGLFDDRLFRRATGQTS
jgi:NitT/TauT family transport system substrate-binding protein